MAQAPNIYTGNDINRMFQVVYYYGAFILHFLPLKYTAAETKNKIANFYQFLLCSVIHLLENL